MPSTTKRIVVLPVMNIDGMHSTMEMRTVCSCSCMETRGSSPSGSSFPA